MSNAEPVAAVVSHLSDLSNLAAATLALNLAYLNLQRFRYRAQVRDCAIGELTEIGEENTLSDGIKGSSQYKDLVYLAKLSDNDGLDEAKKREPVKGYKPDGAWVSWYRYLFSHHQDIFIMTFISAVSFFVLVSGDANSIGIWSFFHFLGQNGWVEGIFWFLIFGFMCPAVFVWAGRYITRGACRHAVKCGKELAALIRDIAKEVKPPTTVLPPVANVPAYQFDFLVELIKLLNK